ncbi:MAG: thiamine phosphate synthase [Nitrospiraceae bacterium]|nr:thiamine phosphate synthase [Nitrospiraceae bacterium]|tara:strand:- start:1044 stop:1721 length:678 start_codon:yes stop_codon:yes gene_type:complete
MSPQFRNDHRHINGLYIILDREIAEKKPLSDIVKSALDEGSRLFQYREKHLPKNEIYRVATELRSLTAQRDATLIINDFSDIALAVDADGVHLGQDDVPLADARHILGHDRLIGISTHSIEQAIEAENGGADYIAFGPIYNTQTKDTGLAPLGPNATRELCPRISIPVFGIGGINLTLIAELRSTGLSGVAILSAILHAPDVGAATRQFILEWQSQGKETASNQK